MSSAPLTLERPDALGADLPLRGWEVTVWNDPINLMSYVTYVFSTHFGFPRAEAERLMWQVHHEGQAVVARGNRETMEMHVAALHTFGLWATMAQEPA